MSLSWGALLVILVLLGGLAVGAVHFSPNARRKRRRERRKRGFEERPLVDLFRTKEDPTDP